MKKRYSQTALLRSRRDCQLLAFFNELMKEKGRFSSMDQIYAEAGERFFIGPDRAARIINRLQKGE